MSTHEKIASPSGSPWGGKVTLTKSPSLVSDLPKFNAPTADLDTRYYFFFVSPESSAMADTNKFQPDIGYPITHKESLPPHMQVDVATVTKKASLLVLTFSLFALAIFFSNGFVLFHPYFATLTAIASVIFYVMGAMIGRPTRNIR